MQNSTDIRKLTAEARKLFGELKQREMAIETGFGAVLDRAWKFGKKLNELKTVVGHGSWENWRESTFLKLSKRTACNCMALDRNNPNVQNSAHLSADSVRKFRFGYVPVKDRPKLKGDKKFARPSHHGAIVTECNKLMRRVDVGLYKPEIRELVQDFDPFYQWLTKLRAGATPLGKAA
jgi:hypothetical protein